MIHLLPQPRNLVELEGTTKEFSSIRIAQEGNRESAADVLEITKLRFWNYPEINISQGERVEEGELRIRIIRTLGNFEAESGFSER